VMIDDLTVLSESCAAIATGEPRAGGRRVGIVSTTGGLGGIAADNARDAGSTLPPLPAPAQASLGRHLPAYASTQNPCDLADALTTVEHLLQYAISDFADSGCYDALVVTMAVHPDWLADRLAADMVAATAAIELPVIVLWPGGSMGVDAVAAARAGGVAVVESSASLATVLHTWGMPAPASPAEAEPLPRAAGLGERDLKLALVGGGLDAPRSELAGSVDEVLRAFRGLGSVAVMKAHEPLLDHKARHGLVRRGIADHRAAVRAWRDFQRRAETAGLEVNEVLLEEEVHDFGVEILVSVSRSTLGLELLVGPGGSTAELAGPRPLRIAPVSEDQTAEVGAELNLPAALWPSLWRAVSAIQRVALAYGSELSVLEVNPVLLTEAAPIALDAKLRLRAEDEVVAG
jgi:acetate---CoA ligase (ADP-forming)